VIVDPCVCGEFLQRSGTVSFGRTGVSALHLAFQQIA